MACLLLNHVRAQEGFLYPAHVWSAGIDLSQFNYMLSQEKLNLHIAGSVQYKPVYFFTINTVFGYNNTRDERGQGYAELEKYNSKGGYAKLGFDLSLGISPRYQNKRLFFGYQWGFLRFSESGEFVKKNPYWSDFKYPFIRDVKNYSAGEFVFGYQWISRIWGLRIQGYGMTLKSDNRISNDNSVVNGYRSPFIPGYGYSRGGVNLILLYRLGK